MSTLPPVRKSVVVPASLDEAFDVFTAGIDSWWPRGRSHTLLESTLESVVIEPFVGGRWYHRGVDGSECDNGRVLVWQPPARLVLGWQLDGRWQYVPDVVSEVEVRFARLDDDRVEVTLEHREFHRFGETAAALRAGVDGPTGWPMLLARYEEAVARGRRPAARAPG